MTTQLRRGRRTDWVLLATISGSASSLFGQAVPTATGPAAPRIFVTIGGGNTQLPYYADNAIGFNFGVFLQPFRLLGGEVRGGTYPVSARFVQSPVTGGLHIGRRTPNARWLPFGYIGAGASKAQDSGLTYQPIAASWSPCWQASAGIDISLGRFSWRAAEVSWTKTYTGRHDLRTPYLSTGIVYYTRH